MLFSPSLREREFCLSKIKMLYKNIDKKSIQSFPGLCSYFGQYCNNKEQYKIMQFLEKELSHIDYYLVEEFKRVKSLNFGGFWWHTYDWISRKKFLKRVLIKYGKLNEKEN